MVSAPASFSEVSQGFIVEVGDRLFDPADNADQLACEERSEPEAETKEEPKAKKTP